MQVLGCAMVKPLGPGADGRAVAEIGAFCVAPAFRGKFMAGFVLICFQCLS